MKRMTYLGDFTLELGAGGGDEALLALVENAQAEVLLDGAVLGQGKSAGEVVDVDAVNALDWDVGELDELLTVHGADDGVGEAGGGIGHGESGGTTTGLNY